MIKASLRRVIYNVGCGIKQVIQAIEEHHVLDTNAGKQLSQAATDV
jgi:hypothetical protein